MSDVRLENVRKSFKDMVAVDAEAGQRDGESSS